MSSLRRRSMRRARRGFTLVELVVAMVAGLVVSAAAYTLARNSMQSYQEETRIATAQLAVAVGMGRLQADIARAGYMASPFAPSDPRLCSSANVPPVTAVSYLNGTETITGLPDADFNYGGTNAIEQPDIVVVTGNMTSAEQLEFRGCTSTECFLALERGSMQRLIKDTGGNQAAIRSVFVAVQQNGTARPRMARVVDQSGKESYIEVTEVNIDPVAGAPIVSVKLQIRQIGGGAVANAGTECGFVNRGTGLINPVSVVRYRVGQLCDLATIDPADPEGTCDSPYARALVPTGNPNITGERIRADLLREELSATSARADKFDINYTVPDGDLLSQEIVAEFAVDFDIAATFDSSGGAPGSAQTFIDFNQTAAPTLEQVTDLDPATGRPQRLRALRVRLGTRARFPDRDVAGPTDITGVVTRFFLGPVAARDKYARMRTLQSEISLPNLAGVTW